MKLELGKKYIRRDRQITGQLEDAQDKRYRFYDPKNYIPYTAEGSDLLSSVGCLGDWNLVAEYIDPDDEPAIITGKAGTNPTSINDMVKFPPEKTLRDEFAMAALTGILENSASFSLPSKDLAEISYRLADAMLAARKEMA